MPARCTGGKMNKKCLPYLIAVILIGLLPLTVFSAYVSNTTEIAFGGGNNGSSTTNEEVGCLIIQGAEQFLDAYQNTLVVMQYTENQQASKAASAEIDTALSGSLTAVKSAIVTYEKLIECSKSIPYNPTVIDQLKKFDYTGFLKSNEGYVNPVIFDIVTGYLSAGDIRGLYARLKSGFEGIAALLEKISLVINSGQPTPIEDIWKLNQSFSQTLLTGQYTSQVFSTLTR